MPFQGGEKMTPAWAQRREELLSDCIVSPDVFNPMVDRLGEFVVPYQHALETEASQSGDGMGRKTAWGLDDLVPLMPQVRTVLATMQPGAVVEVQVS
jgi:hypothetical protein